MSIDPPDPPIDISPSLVREAAIGKAGLRRAHSICILRRMRDTDHYAALLGLPKPWFVAKVDLHLADRQVDVYVDHDDEVSWTCPTCSEPAPLYDHAEQRTWRHLDTMQYATYLHARIPRIECDEHGVKQVRLPWAEPKSRFTLLFERFALDVLACTSVSGARSILRITWDEAWNIMQRAVRRGLEKKSTEEVPRYIGVDEKAVAKGHQYVTVVVNPERSRIEYVAIDRESSSLGGYFETIGARAANIEAVAMDMWPAYLNAVRQYVSDAESKIVYDRFHVTRELVDAVDRVRKAEHRHLRRGGKTQLTSTKFWWLHNRESVPRKHRRAFARLRETKLKTGRAWSIKELFRHMWSYRTAQRAAAFWKRWYGWASRCQLEPVKKAAKKLRKNLPYIMNYFTHPITNAMSESMNAQIEKIKRLAQGYRNRSNFITAIYFHCGRLDLYPATHGEA